MLRRLVSLFSRYSAAHLDVTLPGTPITNHDGEAVGYVDSVRLKGGALDSARLGAGIQAALGTGIV